MKILALDLGTHTGYAVGVDNKIEECGTTLLASDWELREQKKKRFDRRCDLRYERLLGFIRTKRQLYDLDWIVFEDVQFTKTTQQSHLWATWRAAIWTVACDEPVAVECCPVGTLKKFATGKGNAKKHGMAVFLTQNPRFKMKNNVIVDTVTGATLDDNAVDALHLLSWAKKTLFNR